MSKFFTLSDSALCIACLFVWSHMAHTRASTLFLAVAIIHALCLIWIDAAREIKLATICGATVAACAGYAWLAHGGAPGSAWVGLIGVVVGLRTIVALVR
ncbi:MAG: hypothetical protein IT342_21850 [Candidatus Melainabacteria bacterium]|nr:hypothetical protein [Candidatus Melainabacteria bacterium]